MTKQDVVLPTDQMSEPLAVYVHWPWCKHKCPYCDFNSHVNRASPDDRYLAALLQEIEQWRARLGPRPVISVFFGGGTPSLMGGPRIGKVLKALDRAFGLDVTTEITVECNPTSSSAELFKDLVAVGVNRVSIGVQSFDDTLLRFLGREHDAGDARGTIEAALRCFKRVNTDFIYGLPEQNLTRWEKDLAEVVDMGLRHISAYQLTIEPNTAFQGAVNRRRWTPMDGDGQADFAEATKARLEQSGFLNYEISNFARLGEACRHNIHVWRYGDYVGIGAGAHGRVKDLQGRRWSVANRKDPLIYLRMIEEGHDQRVVLHETNDTEAVQEAFLLGLRLREGLDLAELREKLPQAVWAAAIDDEALQSLTALQLLRLEGHTLRTTATGWWHVDRLLRDILR